MSAPTAWRQRLITWPVLFLVAPTLTLVFPGLVAGLAVRDAVLGTRWAGVRTALLGLFWVWLQVAGLSCAVSIVAVAWVRGRSGTAFEHDRLYALQDAWVAKMWETTVALYGLDVAFVGPQRRVNGPVVALIRHTSLADAALATMALGIPHGLRPRYVLKRTLLWDPCLDFVGQRLPNAFVMKETGDPAAEVARVASLAENLDPAAVCLIYPEGSRATAARRERAIASLAKRGSDRVAAASALRHLLPPHTGGAVALLQRVPGDVVVISHLGLDGATGLGALSRGILIGGRVRVSMRVWARSELPDDADGLADWVWERWTEMDNWIEAGGPT